MNDYISEVYLDAHFWYYAHEQMFNSKPLLYVSPKFADYLDFKGETYIKYKLDINRTGISYGFEKIKVNLISDPNAFFEV